MKTDSDSKRLMQGRLPRLANGIAAAGCSLVLLAGCGGRGGAPPTVTIGPTATATPVPPTPTRVPDAKVGKIVWAASVDPVTNAPRKAVSKFRSDAPEIFAVVSVSDLRSGSVLSASWTYNDTALNGVAASVVPTALYTGGFAQFHLARGDGAGWPSGKYRIEISLDGAVVRSAVVDVVDS